MIGLIANPKARRVRTDPLLVGRLARILGSEGKLYETESLLELRSAMDELHRLGADVIAVCGGDGSGRVALSEMVRRWKEKPPPAFLPLRGGTMNTIAKNLGVDGTPESLLARLLAARHHGTAVPSAPFEVLQVGEGVAFVFGSAMAARFFQVYERGPKTGLAWASFLAGRTIVSGALRGPFARWLFSPQRARVTVDGTTLPEQRSTLLVAATIPDLGLGLRPTYRAGTVPGRFHLLASSLSPTKLCVQLDRVWRGQPLEGAPHTDTLCTRAEIEFAEPHPYILDGDLFEADRVSLAAGPTLTVLRP